MLWSESVDGSRARIVGEEKPEWGSDTGKDTDLS